MYSVKFYSYFEGDHRNTCHAVSCTHYCIERFQQHAVVTTFEDHTDTKGTSRVVANDMPTSHFHVCFVENEKGKTIDRVGFENDC